MKRPSNRRKAFTLVELLVVIVILSMLATLVAPNVFKHLGRAKKDLVKSKMALIQGALDSFALHCGRYPEDAEGLQVLVTNDDEIEGWNGPYLKQSQLLDPWENPFIYIAEGTVNPGSYDLISLGADGQEGGEGDNEDVVNDF